MEKVDIDNTNLLLSRYSGDSLIVLLTGASGAGKSHLANALEEHLDADKAHVAYFDRIGIPSIEEMVREHGSGEKWQEAKTHEWITKLAKLGDKALVVFEGQYNPQFAGDGCRIAGVTNYLLFVVNCDETTRERRLSELRNQPELINDDMRHWARFLNDKTIALGGTVLDTSSSDISATINTLAKQINGKLSS